MRWSRDLRSLIAEQLISFAEPCQARLGEQMLSHEVMQIRSLAKTLATTRPVFKRSL